MFGRRNRYWLQRRRRSSEIVAYSNTRNRHINNLNPTQVAYLYVVGIRNYEYHGHITQTVALAKTLVA